MASLLERKMPFFFLRSRKSQKDLRDDGKENRDAKDAKQSSEAKTKDTRRKPRRPLSQSILAVNVATASKRYSMMLPDKENMSHRMGLAGKERKEPERVAYKGVVSAPLKVDVIAEEAQLPEGEASEKHAETTPAQEPQEPESPESVKQRFDTQLVLDFSTISADLLELPKAKLPRTHNCSAISNFILSAEDNACVEPEAEQMERDAARLAADGSVSLRTVGNVLFLSTFDEAARAWDEMDV